MGDSEVSTGDNSLDRKIEEGKKRREAKRQRERETFEKLIKQKEAGVALTAEAQEWMDKKAATDPNYAATLNVKSLAKKALNSDSWAGELMKGSSAKFSCQAKPSVEDVMQKDIVGLVTYDEYKRKKEAAEEEIAKGPVVDVVEPQKKKKKEGKKVVLSFDAENDEEQ
mmetsp:Transcript_20973/g.32869  ORF Transcript_20973/g.32869 Transcript_20973/m.32869 type:complete len:168 (+) Transcript_20973:437-940(+)|eukprot:CAMPEP_0184298374 /NCGR_PEP_ID=MMETSP1049-20130417/9208_1 /TAXON_ID=77928 /ORGANISM="Proteomonas sulcata, Strain CCMP704" /LENGTH=167 /DNA_ID=CAMNT_0026608497 /DNA_START=353 /DNA_END=856 /DNA_ORIENTATION=+